MKVSYSWIKDFLEILIDPYELGEKLTMSGLEVEEISELKPAFSGVVSGQILSIAKHPNADRLSLCKVKVGEKVYSIVCGAKNINEMDNVPLALPGAVLSGTKIKKASLRGETSEGMLCSTKELGIGDDHSGILILPDDIETGLDIADYLGLRDTIFDIAITPNRPDCLSIIGVAREIAAITNSPLISDVYIKPDVDDEDECLDIDIREPELCSRYAAKIIEGVKIGRSPLWMKIRLESLGIRSINNVVDITNYVMLERGQPLHAFDYNTITDSKIVVRKAQRGEKIKSLDGEERALDSETLLIADSRKPLAIAGVMGGSDSQVTEDTKKILLESAYFFPASIRKTSKTLNLSTESSFRFERGVDPGDNLLHAIERAASLIKSCAGGHGKKTLDTVKSHSSIPPEIRLRTERVKKVLGKDIGRDEAQVLLGRIGMRSRAEKQGALIVNPPSFRVDVRAEIDLIEEIARLKGYSEFSEELPKVCMSLVRLNRDISIERRVRDILRDHGYLEVINYSFISSKLLKVFGLDKDNLISIMNPLTEEQSVMRPSLLPGLMANLQFNSNHKNKDLRIFELNKVFYKDKDKTIIENKRLSALCSGLRFNNAWDRADEMLDLFDLKGIAEGIVESLGIADISYAEIDNPQYMHPARSYGLMLNGIDCGLLGEIHPDINHLMDIKSPVYFFDIDADRLFSIKRQKRFYEPFDRYPFITRDISFFVDDHVLSGDIIDIIKTIDNKHIDDIKVFDLYRGEGIPKGKKSLALRIKYRSKEKTLTEHEISLIHDQVIKKLTTEFDLNVR